MEDFLYLFEYRAPEETEVTVRKFYAESLKEASLEFMLHINEEFDDDLLYDAIEILDQ